MSLGVRGEVAAPNRNWISQTFERNTDYKVEEDRDVKEEVIECYSTYEERLRQTPNESGERGYWEGERGESKFIPNNEEMKGLLKVYGVDGVEYRKGIVDFSPFSESTVKIDGMNESRYENFQKCDVECAKQWALEQRSGKEDWTARDVSNFRRAEGYTWHERNDRQTCDLVPTKTNDYFGHLGGVGECIRANREVRGGIFDEE